MPPVEAAAAFVAYHEVLYPLFPIKARGGWTQVWNHYAWTPVEAPHDGPERWVRTDDDHNARRAVVNAIRAQHIAQAPDLFATPRARVAAIDELRTALSEIELQQLPGSSTLPSLGAYLSQDLQTHSERVYTGTLERVHEALCASSELHERLHAAWQASDPKNPLLVRTQNGEIQIEGTHRITHEPPAALARSARY